MLLSLSTAFFATCLLTIKTRWGHSYKRKGVGLKSNSNPVTALHAGDDGGCFDFSSAPTLDGFFAVAVTHEPVAYPLLPQNQKPMMSSPLSLLHPQQVIMAAADYHPWQQHHHHQQRLIMTAAYPLGILPGMFWRECHLLRIINIIWWCLPASSITATSNSNHWCKINLYWALLLPLGNNTSSRSILQFCEMTSCIILLVGSG